MYVVRDIVVLRGGKSAGAVSGAGDLHFMAR